MLPTGTTPDREEAKQALERVLASRVFAKAERSRRFLRYLVESAMAQPPIAVKEYTIALDVFDRDKSYDPSIDATVRVEASRLRARLREYYLEEGAKTISSSTCRKAATPPFCTAGPGAKPPHPQFLLTSQGMRMPRARSPKHPPKSTPTQEMRRNLNQSCTERKSGGLLLWRRDLPPVCLWLPWR